MLRGAAGSRSPAARAPVATASSSGGISLTSQDTAIACARIADELKGEDIVILDLRKLTPITDYFVLCSGASERQLKAIGDRILLDLKSQGITRLGVEGEAAGGWLLLDYVDVVVHAFSREARAFYALEMLWGDAPKVAWAP